MVLGLLLALISCVMYGVATLIQAVGSRKAEGLGAFIQPLVLIGLVVDGGAFLVSLVAYSHAPLFLVQTIIAAAVVISVLGAPRVMAVQLRRIDIVGAVIVVIGLIFVALAAGPEHDAATSHRFMELMVLLTVATGAVTAVVYRWAPAWLMALLSGIGFSLVAIGARAAEVDGSLLDALLHPVALVVLGGGAIGVVGNIRALEKGSVAIAASIVSVVEVVIPSVVGITVLGDAVREGWLVPLILAVLLALGGCTLLAASPAGRATAS